MCHPSFLVRTEFQHPKAHQKLEQSPLDVLPALCLVHLLVGEPWSPGQIPEKCRGSFPRGLQQLVAYAPSWACPPDEDAAACKSNRGDFQRRTLSARLGLRTSHVPFGQQRMCRSRNRREFLPAVGPVPSGDVGSPRPSKRAWTSKATSRQEALGLKACQSMDQKVRGRV